MFSPHLLHIHPSSLPSPSLPFLPSPSLLSPYQHSLSSPFPPFPLPSPFTSLPIPSPSIPSLPYSLSPSLLLPSPTSLLPTRLPGAILFYYYSLPQSSGLSIACKYTSCVGSEYNILDCSHSCQYIFSHYFGCSHYMVVGVKCQRKSKFPGFCHTSSNTYAF